MDSSHDPQTLSVSSVVPGVNLNYIRNKTFFFNIILKKKKKKINREIEHHGTREAPRIFTTALYGS